MKSFKFLLPLTAAMLLSCTTGTPTASSEALDSSEGQSSVSETSEQMSSQESSIQSEDSAESAPSSEILDSSEEQSSEQEMSSEEELSSEEMVSSEEEISSGSEESSVSSEDHAGGYYDGIDFTASGKTLKTKLSDLISRGYVSKSYDYAYTAYPLTDTDSDGKIIDVYSSYRYDPAKDHQGASGKGNYNAEGQMFNREHTIPQSVFNEASPMKSDLHHLLPTDAYVNNRRSNYVHAYVATAKYTSTNKTLVGTVNSSKSHGCSSASVCEVPDEFKGDIARIYFYMVTRYEDKLSGWKSYDAFSKNSYPSLTKWAVETYLEWNDLDPVSPKEIKRNDEVFKIQNNRNPFIDHPEAAHQIWDNAY